MRLKTVDSYFYQPGLIPAFCSVKHPPKVTDWCHFRSVCRDLLVERHLFLETKVFVNPFSLFSLTYFKTTTLQ